MRQEAKTPWWRALATWKHGDWEREGLPRHQFTQYSTDRKMAREPQSLPSETADFLVDVSSDIFFFADVAVHFTYLLTQNRFIVHVVL